MKTVVVGLVLVVVVAAATWALWPSSLGWAGLTSASPQQLRAFIDDGDRGSAEWAALLEALRDKNTAALPVVEKLCPHLAKAAHPSEQVLDALTPFLEERPREIIQRMKACLPVRVLCSVDDAPTALRITAALDGGTDDVSTACRAAMGTK